MEEDIEDAIFPWRDFVKYDETSESCLRWVRKVGRGRGHRLPGSVAGSISNFGGNIHYWRIGLDKKQYFNHIIVWNIFNGKIEKGLVINHIDNNPLNNKIENLEVVTQKENIQKSCQHNGVKLRALNTTGILGVSDHIKIIKGVTYCYAQAQFRDEYGKKIQKYFKYAHDDKTSKEKAFEEAYTWRKSNLNELVKDGLAYYNMEKI